MTVVRRLTNDLVAMVALATALLALLVAAASAIASPVRPSDGPTGGLPATPTATIVNARSSVVDVRRCRTAAAVTVFVTALITRAQHHEGVSAQAAR